MQETKFFIDSVIESFEIPLSTQKKCNELYSDLDFQGTHISNSLKLSKIYSLIIPHITDSDWPWIYGQQLTPNDMGFLHLAATSCESLQDFFDIFQKYSELSTPVKITCSERDGRFKIILKLPSEYCSYYWVHIGIIASFLTELIIRFFNVSVSDIRISIPLKKEHPMIALDVRKFCVQYENECFCFDLDSKLLKAKNKKYHQGLLVLALRECEKSKIEFNRDASYSAKINSIFATSGDRFPSLEMIAYQLNTSSRNVRKKLMNENTSFRDILQENKFSRAIYLLKNTRFSIDEIGGKIGYSDSTSFRRAFVNELGVPPSFYR